MTNYMRAGALALVLATLALTARAEPAPIASLQEADAQLAAVAARRAEVEARFGAGERACYQQFFVNRCLDQAREARRTSLVGLREIENGAHRFKRAEAVAKRDRLLEEQQRNDAQEAAERALKVPRAAPPPTDDASAGLAPAPHAARTVVSRASAAAEAGRRAASVAAFERKQRAAAERQRLVAQKQAKKAKKVEQSRKTEAAAGK